MAANIDMTNGKAASLYVGALPWHNLVGTHLPAGTVLTTTQMLEASGTNWEVQEAPVQYVTPHGVHTADKRVLYRSDNGAFLHVCSPTYQIHQHTLLAGIGEEAFSVAGEMGIDMAWNAGFAMAGGRRITYVLELKGRMIDVLGDVYLPFLMITTSHDESWPTTFKYVAFRPECENMTRMALAANTPQFTLRHTSRSEGRIQMLREGLKIIPKAESAFDLWAARLAETPYPEAKMVKLTGKVCPIDKDDKDRKRVSPNVRRREEILSVWANDKRVASAQGALKALQAVSTWEQHVRGDKPKLARIEGNMNRFLSDSMEFTNRCEAALADEFEKVLVMS